MYYWGRWKKRQNLYLSSGSCKLGIQLSHSIKLNSWSFCFWGSLNPFTHKIRLTPDAVPDSNCTGGWKVSGTVPFTASDNTVIRNHSLTDSVLFFFVKACSCPLYLTSAEETSSVQRVWIPPQQPVCHLGKKGDVVTITCLSEVGLIQVKLIFLMAILIN